MNILERLHARAAGQAQHIMLSEAEDPRTLQAAIEIQVKALAQISLVGIPERIKCVADKEGIDISSISIININDQKLKSHLADIFYERRKARGITPEESIKTLEDPLYFANLLINDGQADGSVAGAINTTAHTVRAAILCLGLQEGMSIVSSFFLMVTGKSEYGSNGSFIFSDCAVVPNPTPEQLGDIAISAAESCRTFLEVEPLVSLLSFSTRGSADDPLVQKVSEAVKIVQAKRSDLIVDGELQLDAAIVPSIGQKKAIGSPVAGRANVLVFPDLNAGNIGYKLTERLADAEAIGPVLQGLSKPANDLSRGCSAGDIVNTVALTAIQSISLKNR